MSERKWAEKNPRLGEGERTREVTASHETLKKDVTNVLAQLGEANTLLKDTLDGLTGNLTPLASTVTERISSFQAALENTLLSSRILLSFVATMPVTATLQGLTFLLLFLVLRLVTRRDWIAAAILVAFLVTTDLIESDVRAAFTERALTPAAAATEIRPVATSENSRLQGAAALVTAPAFAAPVVA